MESQSISRRAALASLAFAAIAPVGCFGKWFVKKDDPQQPSSQPKLAAQGRVLSAWDHKVVFAPDTLRGGAAMPGLSGRVFLFGPDLSMPFIGDGSLIVDVYDSTPRDGPNTQPKMIEQLRIDPISLKLLAKKDVWGDGYSIFFPWYTYRPDIAQIYIMMRYDSAKGESLFHQSGTFSIDHSETIERVKKGMPVTNPAMQTSAN